MKTKKECGESPNGKHLWEETKDEADEKGRTKLNIIPGWYCLHCGLRKSEAPLPDHGSY